MAGVRQSLASISAERARTASRLRVLGVLRSSPAGCHVQQVAERTGLHPNTVRFHLERLESDGLVSRHVRRSGEPGRPPLAYVANPVPDAEQGRRNFGQLAEVLAQLVTRTNQDPAVVAVEAGRSWGLSRTGTSEAANGAAAIAELTATLDELGFAPEVCVDDDDGHPIILQRHCPFLEVAQAHQDVVCSVHLGLMRGTLDRLDVPVTVERLIPFANTAGCEAHLTAGGATSTTV
ncbi:transcriptional regulator [Georgenia satyanarayanai]|uniref:Transcriptional regulator n=1 Tax=Georgenia satyanarayanai TaxID=860221 RepID=A0A2Y9APR9_9MICO|nr:helix-turn-helix domain-containing protein [Georgenia satyanarayanai]PYF97295.1 transcriptional regulator [Georgenia satyanarayanai]SSA46076.1 transcriptional regulator [Georgenia satyanarayanai]